MSTGCGRCSSLSDRPTYRTERYGASHVGDVVETDLQGAMKEVSRSVGVVLAEYSVMADIVGEAAASAWMSQSMAVEHLLVLIEASGHVDTELLECLDAVWRATDALVSMMCNRVQGRE